MCGAKGEAVKKAVYRRELDLGRWGKKRTSVGAQLMTSVGVVKEFGEMMGMIDVW